MLPAITFAKEASPVDFFGNKVMKAELRFAPACRTLALSEFARCSLGRWGGTAPHDVA